MKSHLAKKQLTMITLVLALALAVYLNWRFAQNDALTITDTITETAADAEGEKYYGEAQFVSTDEADPDSYFAEARLNRQQSRDEAMDALQKALQDTNLTQAEKDAITASMAAIASNIATESNIETLVKAKGFSDCVAFINGDKVKIVVKANGDGLSSSEVSQIKEIVLSECSSVPVQNITIVEVK